MLDHGLALIARGYHIFPAQRGDKTPQPGTLWNRVSTDSEPAVRAWRARYPGDDLVWAVDCGKSGVVVVDNDGGDWPDAPAYRTPRGAHGGHCYYAEPRDHIVGSDNTGKLGPALDVKGLGGYVVAWGLPPAASGLPACPDVVVERMRRGAGTLRTDVQTSSQNSDRGALEGAATPRTFTPAEALAFVQPAVDRMIGTPVGSGLYQAINDAALMVGHFVPAFMDEVKARNWLQESLWSKYLNENIERTPKGDSRDLKYINIGLRDSDWKASARAQTPFDLDREPPAPDAVENLLREMRDSDGLDAIEDLEPVVKGWLWRNTIARINGKSGNGKSFVALDIAGHVGSGMDWRGNSTPPGIVVYAVAEGAQGFRKRVRAWERFHDRKMTGVRFLPRPLQVGGPEWATFIAACQSLNPSLIVLDTQARVTVGINENDNTEMGVMVHQADLLVRATTACVTFVHHLGHFGEEGRGATAVKAALQTEILVSRLGRDLTVKLPKQKDDADETELKFRMHVFEIDKDDQGEPITSCVLISPDSPLAPVEKIEEIEDKRKRWQDEAIDAQTFVIGIFHKVFPTGSGGTKAEVWTSVRESYTMPKSTFYYVWGELEERGVIGRVEASQRFKIVPMDERIQSNDSPTSPILSDLPGNL
jgi:hypothetical protein